MSAAIFAPDAFHTPNRFGLAHMAFECMREAMIARQPLFPAASEQIWLATRDGDYARIYGTVQFVTKVLDSAQAAGWGCSFGDGKEPEALRAALNATGATRKSKLCGLGDIELELQALSGMCAALDQLAQKSANLDWLKAPKKKS